MTHASDAINSTRTDARVYLVTGATGAIGKAIARQLAESRHAEVVLLCRDPNKAQRAVDDIVEATGNAEVRYELADLGSHDAIRALARRWTGPLHGLVNNAAITPRGRRETPEGIEMQFAVNVLGYFRLIDAFKDVLTASAPARVVNVASYWAGGLDLTDLEFTRRGYDSDSAYRQSKQADRMLSAAFAEKFDPGHVTVNACHPGDVHSALSHSLGFGGHETPDQGAETPVWLATGAEGGQVTGKYFEHKRECTCNFGRNREAVRALYDVCAGYSRC